METPRSDLLVVRLPRKEIDQIAALALARGYTTSEVVRLLVRRFLKGSITIGAKPSEHTVAGAAEVA